MDMSKIMIVRCSIFKLDNKFSQISTYQSHSNKKSAMTHLKNDYSQGLFDNAFIKPQIYLSNRLKFASHSAIKLSKIY